MSKPTATKAKQLTTEQRKYLQAQIQAMVSAAHSKAYEADPKRPAAVVAAEKVSSDWHKKMDIDRATERKRVNAAADKAREVLLFGSPDEALAAVKALEAQYARRAA